MSNISENSKSSKSSEIRSASYQTLLRDLKERIHRAQLKAALSVNAELVMLYWQIGRDILQQQEQHGWGAKVIDRLSVDLRREFPGMKGFSPRNLKYMRRFAEVWTDPQFVQQVAAQIPWFHNCVLLDKLNDSAVREWYLRQTIEHAWSRNVLVIQIESRLHERQGQALTNFGHTLPPPQSDLAQQILKDPYNFEFLTLEQKARERELEHGLLEHIRQFLLELGVGFAFVGSQYHLEVGDEDYYLDLLFYHLQLRCFIIIDLKMGAFQPEHAGKMNFYLAAVDDLLRHSDDQPSLGMILCKTKDRITVEYALRDIGKPIGVSEFRVLQALPENLQSSLPTVEQLEAELGTELGNQDQQDAQDEHNASHESLGG